MGKNFALFSLLVAVSMLSGCAGMGIGGRNTDHFNGAIVDVGNNSRLGIIGDKTKYVENFPLDLFGTLEPILREGLFSVGINEGPLETVTPGVSALVHPSMYGKEYLILCAAHAEVESGEVVNMRTYIWAGKPPRVKGEKAEKIFDKNYTATVFMDKVMLSGPDAQAKINAALAQKYKNIVPQIASDLAGLKLQF